MLNINRDNEDKISQDKTKTKNTQRTLTTDTGGEVAGQLLAAGVRFDATEVARMRVVHGSDHRAVRYVFLLAVVAHIEADDHHALQTRR